MPSTNASSKELISSLETKRNSRVITYLTSDRAVLGAQIALDVLSLFYDTLERMGKTEKISLYLYSTGGSTETPWPLVSLIREYCDYLEVLVPFKALSAATLISLGANRIIMTPLSQLSSVDPTGIFVTEGKEKQIAVEDIQSYIEFAKEKIGIAESQPLSEVLRLLADEVSPQMLGRVNRTHSLIRRIARLMLQLHLTEPKCGTQIDEIVNNLTEQLYSHTHMINRREARDNVGFREIIEFADEDTSLFIQKLFKVYADQFDLAKPFNPSMLFEDDTTKEISRNIPQALIETKEVCHRFETPIRLIRENGKVGIEPTDAPRWDTQVAPA
ncbi:MAG: hypothetical protein GY797_20130 [Deltaproteobacteria bacterium]|nr:hypothetical protein [Deltaproteobacteria bacterium]